MHILAISGSLREASTNALLVRAIATLAPEHIHITIYNGLADLPHFNPDLDGENSPASVRTLREQLGFADGVLICTPEYAFGIPGVLKNALDWIVSTGDFSGKPVAAVSASPLWTGGEKALASLLLTLSALGANVPAGGTLSIPMVNKKLAADGKITDDKLKQALQNLLQTLAQAIED